MKKTAGLFIAALFSLSAFAQSIQEGINHLYAERNASAKSTFERMIASNPNNLDAIYWLGQSHLATDNTAAARSVYEKALASNGNAPVILVGMGHVELIEGNTAAARQRFETAISLSRGKKGDDPNILNAIGRANIDAKQGDVAYAISKLTQASQLAPGNADIFINLGNAYRKAKDGGQAVTSYMKAAQLSPAIAYYRMARIYETQRNWDIFNENLNRSLSADPRFAPSYLSQYYYNLLYKKDFAAADEIAKKYISSSDPSIDNEYFRAQTLYLQKKYDEAIGVGQNIISQSGAQLNPRVYRMMAYSYMEKGDTATARQYVDQFFAKASEEDYVPQDFVLKANVYSKDNPEAVVDIYLAAAENDTTTSNKLMILQEGVQWAIENKRKIPEADLKLAIFRLNPNANPASLFQIGLPYYQGQAYRRADSIFNAYAVALPDSIYGHYWSALSRSQIDSTMEQGLAVSAYEKALAIAETDTVRFKNMGIQSSGYLAGYYNNVKKDKATAITYLQKGLKFDPANASFLNSIKVLSAPEKRSSATKPQAQTSSSAGQAKDVKVKVQSSGTKVKKN